MRARSQGSGLNELGSARARPTPLIKRDPPRPRLVEGQLSRVAGRRESDGILALFLLIILNAPPNRGRELSSREAVLPLMYRVKEDGLYLSLIHI